MKNTEMESIQSRVQITIPVFEVISVTPKMARYFKKGDCVYGLPHYMNIFRQYKDGNFENYCLPLRCLKFHSFANHNSNSWFLSPTSWIPLAKSLGKTGV